MFDHIAFDGRNRFSTRDPILQKYKRPEEQRASTQTPTKKMYSWGRRCQNRQRFGGVVNTICAPRYPTSYKPDAVAFGHSPIFKRTSRLGSITYSFQWQSGTPSAYVYIINEDYSGKIIPAAPIHRSEWRRKDSHKGVFMLYRRLSQFLTAVALALAFVAFAGVSGGSEAKAQGIYRNYHRPNAIIRHRQQERYYWLRHRERERDAWRRHERFERYRYNNRFGRYPFYRRW